MSIYEERRGHCTPSYSPEAPMSVKEFLEKALAAIRRRRGLIHGSWNNRHGVCAMGAFGAKHDGAVVPYAIGNALQAFNDSMPKATPALRRRKVISWLENKLASLPTPNGDARNE